MTYKQSRSYRKAMFQHFIIHKSKVNVFNFTIYDIKTNQCQCFVCDEANPFNVNELCFEDFYDIKRLANDIGPLNMSEIKLSQVKIIKVEKESTNSVFYKISYAEDEFKEATVIKKKKQATSIILNKAFHSKPSIPKNKKRRQRRFD